ncbi:MAG: hypothetical protein WC806_01490 [Candidatus Gracilibacteria bacterium]|jgi:hypothetical protein
MSKEKLYLKILIDALKNLASDYNDQIKAFPDFVCIPDELALNYYDAFLLSNQVLEAKLINKDQYKKIKKLDDYFDKLSGKKHIEFWKLDALKTDSRWEKARIMAKEILSSIKLPDDIDQYKNNIQYIGSKN